MIYGKIYSPRATKIIDHAVAETREQVATLLFARNPKARTVTTSRAFERNGEWTDSGSDIRWIERPSFDAKLNGATK